MWPFRFIPQGESQVPIVHINRVDEAAILPARSSDGSAGYDVYSSAPVTIQPGEIGDIPTGLRMEIPPQFYAQIKSRSSVVLFKKLIVLAGVIDSDFRGLVRILLLNTNSHEVVINMNEKIAQIVFLPCIFPLIVESAFLTPTVRNEKGFGSTNEN